MSELRASKAPVLGLGIIGKRNRPLLILPFRVSSATTLSSPSPPLPTKSLSSNFDEPSAAAWRSSPDEDADIELQLAFHSALDVIEERAAAAASASNPAYSSPYIGLLGLIGRFAVYAYVSSTGLKVVVALDADHEPNAKDEDVKTLLYQVYSCYVDWASNPFVRIGLLDEVDPVPRLDQPSPGVERLVGKLVGLAQKHTIS